MDYVQNHTKSQTRNWTMCSILSATLLLAPFANADTTKTFTVKQTTANNANDLFVNFNNLGLVPMSNIIHDANGMTVGLFKTAAVTPPGSGSILYTNPVNNMGNPLTIPQNYTVTFTVQSKGTGATMNGFKLLGGNVFSMGNGVNIPNSVQVVSANVDLMQNPATSLASLDFGNEGDDYLFLHQHRRVDRADSHRGQ